MDRKEKHPLYSRLAESAPQPEPTGMSYYNSFFPLAMLEDEDILCLHERSVNTRRLLYGEPMVAYSREDEEEMEWP